MTNFKWFLYNPLFKNKMGQALFCCGCCWDFVCWIHWCSLGLCCFSCCMCADQHLLLERGIDYCMCEGCDHGYGYTCFPEWLKKYSIPKYISKYMGPLDGDIQVSPLTSGNPHSVGQVQMAGVQQPNYNHYPYQGWYLKLFFWSRSWFCSLSRIDRFSW